MSVDFSKPIRFKNNCELPVRYLETLDKKGSPYFNIVVATIEGGVEQAATYDESCFENIPQSRWATLYDKGDYLDVGFWRESLEVCKVMDGGGTSVGIIEDKQDGSTYVLHPVR